MSSSARRKWALLLACLSFLIGTVQVILAFVTMVNSIYLFGADDTLGGILSILRGCFDFFFGTVILFFGMIAIKKLIFENRKSVRTLRGMAIYSALVMVEDIILFATGAWNVAVIFIFVFVVAVFGLSLFVLKSKEQDVGKQEAKPFPHNEAVSPFATAKESVSFTVATNGEVEITEQTGESTVEFSQTNQEVDK